MTITSLIVRLLGMSLKIMMRFFVILLFQPAKKQERPKKSRRRNLKVKAKRIKLRRKKKK